MGQKHSKTFKNIQKPYGTSMNISFIYGFIMFYMGSRPPGHQLDSWHGPLEAKLLAFGPGETFQAALGEARNFGLNRGLPGLP
jgi:hypothetical protein